LRHRSEAGPTRRTARRAASSRRSARKPAALSARRPQSPALDRYREVAAIVTGRPDAEARDGIAWVEALVRALAVPGLSHWGATAADVPALVAKARAASSMKGNPVELTEAEIAEIVVASL
jgi:alcohol dehydrogenase class IV